MDFEGPGVIVHKHLAARVEGAGDAKFGDCFFQLSQIEQVDGQSVVDIRILQIAVEGLFEEIGGALKVALPLKLSAAVSVAWVCGSSGAGATACRV